jgi:hypothetical protein
MESLGLNYAYGRMSDENLSYPYWVGEFSEEEPVAEDGGSSPVMILTGFSRKTDDNSYVFELETEKEKIRSHFWGGKTFRADNGSGVFIYSNCINIPLDELDIRKCEIRLSCRFWSGTQ